MTSLERFQRAFVRSLAGGSGAGRAPRTRSARQQAAGLAVYRANLRAGRHDALAAAYPVVRRLVGEAFFREMALRYAERWPSRSGDLHGFGEALPRFIERYRRARALPWLADVARLEWARHESLDAAEAPPWDPAALLRVPPKRRGALRLALHPSARLVESPHPIVAILEANAEGRDGTPRRHAGPDRVLVWRRGLEVRVRRLGRAPWTLARALAGGATLGEALAALGTGSARSFGPALARLGAEGVIAGPVPPADEA